jgi:hypothetical protein
VRGRYLIFADVGAFLLHVVGEGDYFSGAFPQRT